MNTQTVTKGNRTNKSCSPTLHRDTRLHSSHETFCLFVFFCSPLSSLLLPLNALNPYTVPVHLIKPLSRFRVLTLQFRMASQTASNPIGPSAQVVGNAFVEQYYYILLTSPELVHRFYQDSSVLSRPDANGVMTSVTTMQDINEKILSLDFKGCKAEIKTADAQLSHKDGVTVLVTGCFTGKDNVKRKFAQSFFLAPQDNGYFVLNDVFRYVDGNESLESHPAHGIDSNPIVPSVPDQVPAHVPDPSAPNLSPSVVEEHKKIAEKANESSDHEKQLVNDREINVEDISNEHNSIVESASSMIQEDAPKKSYALIVKVVKENSLPTKANLPANTTKIVPKRTENQSEKSVAPVLEPETSVPNSNDATESSSAHEEAEGYSIYIRNLPFNFTVSQLEAEFEKFGPIKEGGVQIRYNKQQGYCFGFVEFQSLNSMNSAIEASPLTIGGHRIVVEMKRTSTRVGSGRGGFSSGRAGFRNDKLQGSWELWWWQGFR
ncbi:G3BP protein [Salix suchowensis]|nr:G3BP protein [Salix suchowensis]